MMQRKILLTIKIVVPVDDGVSFNGTVQEFAEGVLKKLLNRESFNINNERDKPVYKVEVMEDGT